MKRTILTVILGVLMLAGTSAFAAKRPMRNVNPKRHPNIAAAQRACQNAYNKVVAAQKANEFDMNGHAQNAKDLLDKANTELKQAAEAANQNMGK
jgi:F0F1-type ATP synthase membrane subunit b/b'